MDLQRWHLWSLGGQALIFPKALHVKSKTEKQLPQGETHEEEPSFKVNHVPGISQSTTSVEPTCWILNIPRFFPHSIIHIPYDFPSQVPVESFNIPFPY